MLLVVIGYRQKGGVSKTRVGEILRLETSSYLDDLLSEELVYCDLSRECEFLAADAIGFAGTGLSVLHRHSGAQRARGVVTRDDEFAVNVSIRLPCVCDRV